MSEEEDRYLEDRRRRLLHCQPYDVEKWCGILKGETFRTFYFDLTYEECEAIVTYFRVHGLRSKRRKFTEDQKKILEGVEMKIRKIMEENPSKDGFFVRLSTRSPKDAVLSEGLKCCERMNLLLEKFMRKLYIEDDGKLKDEDDTIPNREYSFLMKAGCYSMNVENSSQAMEMILNSERTYTDILLMMDFRDLFEKHPMKMIIRHWNKDLRYRNEFRCFVRDNQLNAASQYDSYVYFPKLIGQKEKLGGLIKEYFDNKIAPILKENGFRNYVIDIGILNGDKPVVIELNGFDEVEDSARCGTGSSCFSWKDDLKILMEGPYEFRIVEKPPVHHVEETKDLKAYQFHPMWKFIYAARKKVLEEKDSGDCNIL